jgi:LDH2 family malate/lactate/ureidoglycolate dehydrogenase
VSQPILVSADALRTFAVELIEAWGASAEDAERMADVLLWADLRGRTFFGVAKLPQFYRRVRSGVTSVRGRTSMVAESPSCVAFDAHDTFSHMVGPRAMLVAARKARATGIGLASVRNATSAGALGYFALLAARAGLIGFAANDSTPLQSAWGGVGRTLGNQAFAIAAPAGRHPMLLFDTATSALTHAEIHRLAALGAPLPEGTALDPSGRPTTIPEEALRGVLLPMGEHRGSGLALMLEVLTGVFSGGPRFGPGVGGPDDISQPQGVSLCLLALDPAVVQPPAVFRARVDELVDHVHASTPASEVDVVRVPGERSAMIEEERRRDGVPIDPALADQLRELGQPFDVCFPG